MWTSRGALAPVEPQEPAGPSALDPLLAEAGEAAAAWLDAVEGRVVEDLQAQLATPRVLRELQDRWQAEYAELSARALRLRDQSREIERDFREAKKNPLRNAARFEELQQQLAAAQSELKQTLADLQARPAQTQADRQAVDAARRQDEQLLRRAVQVAKTDGGQLSQYLLGETAHGYLTQAVWWIDAARRWTPSSRIERPARARGTTVLFVNRPRPQCLVQRLALSGTAGWGGQPLQWTGELTDAASQPRLHPQPLQLAVELHGAMDGQLTVTLDRRGEAPLDTLVLDCPRLPVDATSLGAADKLAVAVAPGDAALAAHIQLAGRALDGEITLRQATSLTMQTAAIRDDRIAAMLAESLAEVDRIEAHVTLSGTLDRPRVAVQSNLGPQLASGIHGAMRRYLTDRRDRLAAKVQAGADEQLARLQTQRQQAQAELMAKLGENQELFGQLATLMGGGGALNPAAAVPQLGSKLNLERLTR